MERGLQAGRGIAAGPEPAREPFELPESHLLGPSPRVGHRLRRVPGDALLEEGLVGNRLGFAELAGPALPQQPPTAVPGGLAGRGAADQAEVAVEVENRHGVERLLRGVALLAMPDRAVLRQVPVPVARALDARLGRPPVDLVAVS